VIRFIYKIGDTREIYLGQYRIINERAGDDGELDDSQLMVNLIRSLYGVKPSPIKIYGSFPCGFFNDEDVLDQAGGFLINCKEHNKVRVAA